MYRADPALAEKSSTSNFRTQHYGHEVHGVRANVILTRSIFEKLPRTSGVICGYRNQESRSQNALNTKQVRTRAQFSSVTLQQRIVLSRLPNFLVLILLNVFNRLWSLAEHHHRFKPADILDNAWSRSTIPQFSHY
jgi:hypothetical protein